jgi:hypothetical protein
MRTTRYFIVFMSIFSFLFGGCAKQPAGNFAISDKELLVRGWSDTELRQIIGDFQQTYRVRLPTSFSTEVHAGNGGTLRVTFPADIAPEFFCWLVNYVQYPKGFDLKSRTILVAGRATMSSDFLPSEQSLIGKRITFYIPTNDNQYDEVFAQVDGQSYEYPFTSERWRRAQESRLPVGVSDLK